MSEALTVVGIDLQNDLQATFSGRQQRSNLKVGMKALAFDRKKAVYDSLSSDTQLFFAANGYADSAAKARAVISSTLPIPAIARYWGDDLGSAFAQLE